MKNTLRWLLVFEWLLILSSIGVGIALEESLPEELRQWIVTDGSDVSVTEGALYVSVLLGSIVGTVGLFFMKRWAAWLYLLSTLLATSANWSPVVQHPLEAMLEELSLLVAGLVIGVSFLSGVARGRKEPNQSPQRNAGGRSFSSDSSVSETQSSLGPRG